MRSRTLVISAAALLLAFGVALPSTTTTQRVWAQAPARIQIEFWHAMRGPLGDSLNGIAARFNASQTRYRVNSGFKGSYPDTMVAAIAAFRAGNAPHIVQMFEVGTATMMAAGPAIKPVHQLFKEAGIPFDPTIYLPAVRGYYSDAAGRMVAMPFNSSTPVLWYNKDAFRKAGLDPNAPQRRGQRSGPRRSESGQRTRRPVGSQQRGRRGCNSRPSAQYTTLRWRPRPTGSKASTPS